MSTSALTIIELVFWWDGEAARRHQGDGRPNKSDAKVTLFPEDFGLSTKILSRWRTKLIAAFVLWWKTEGPGANRGRPIKDLRPEIFKQSAEDVAIALGTTRQQILRWAKKSDDPGQFERTFEASLLLLPNVVERGIEVDGVIGGSFAAFWQVRRIAGNCFLARVLRTPNFGRDLLERPAGQPQLEDLPLSALFRRLDESQRAIVAARIATLRDGQRSIARRPVRGSKGSVRCAPGVLAL